MTQTIFFGFGFRVLLVGNRGDCRKFASDYPSKPCSCLVKHDCYFIGIVWGVFCDWCTIAGALEIIVYAGAIMVLFIFVMMMLNLGSHDVEEESSWLTSSAWAVPAGLTFIVGLVVATQSVRHSIQTLR